MKLNEVKKGDIIRIEFGSSIHRATVVNNFPDKNRIILKSCDKEFVAKYGDYYVENFNILNDKL